MSKKRVMQLLVEAGREEKDYWLEEMEWATSQKEKDSCWRHYRRAGEQVIAICDVLTKEMLEMRYNEEVNEEILRIAREIEATECLGDGYRGYIEVKYDDCCRKVEEWEIKKYGLSIEDKLRLAVVVYYFHREE